MLEKQCTKCLLVKPVSEFVFKNKKKGKLSARCKTCTRASINTHYQNNKTYYVKKARKRNITIRKDCRQNILEHFYLNPCCDCGETDPVVLEFDHVRGKKVSEVSVMIHRGWSWDKIENEIKKCDVRCANCHKRKTAKQFGFWSADLPPKCTG